MTQAAKIGESKTSENRRSKRAKSAETPTAFDAAVSEFLSYLQGYRQYSPWTVGAYRIDLREFREFLLEQQGGAPAPAEITRPQVVAWGLKLRAMKPLTIRRKYACLSSFPPKADKLLVPAGHGVGVT